MVVVVGGGGGGGGGGFGPPCAPPPPFSTALRYLQSFDYGESTNFKIFDVMINITAH